MVCGHLSLCLIPLKKLLDIISMHAFKLESFRKDIEAFKNKFDIYYA